MRISLSEAQEANSITAQRHAQLHAVLATCSEERGGLNVADLNRSGNGRWNLACPRVVLAHEGSEQLLVTRPLPVKAVDITPNKCRITDLEACDRRPLSQSRNAKDIFVRSPRGCDALRLKALLERADRITQPGRVFKGLALTRTLHLTL